MLQRFEEIQIAVSVIEDREVDEAPALVRHQQIVGVRFRRDARRCGARGDGFVLGRLVVEVRTHFVLQRPASGDDHHQADEIAFGKFVRLGQHALLERRVFKFRILLGPRQIDDLFPGRAEAERMHRAAPSHNDAVSAQRNLRDDVGAFSVLSAHFADLFFKWQFFGDRLQRRKRHWQLRFAR